MAPLSGLQIQVDRWSKLTLIGATVLFIFSFLTFIGSSEKHHHHKKHHMKEEGGALSTNTEDHQFFDQHREQHRREKHAARERIHHFAALGLATSVTGVVSAFKVTRGWALGFLVLVLITEISALGIIGFESAHAGQKCVARSVGAQMIGASDAKPVPGVSSSSSSSSSAIANTNNNNNNNAILISAVQRTVQLPNGDIVQEEVVRIDGVQSQQQQQQVDENTDKKEHHHHKKDKKDKKSHSHSESKSHSKSKSRSHSKMFKKLFSHHADPADLRGCLAHVRHVGVLASLIIGVLACSLACCGSRYTNLVSQRDEEEAAAILRVQTKEAPVEVISNGEVVMMMPIGATSLLPVEKEQPQTVVVA